MDIRDEALKMHYEWKGKIEMTGRVSADSARALSLAYTPGVAEPCLAIEKDEAQSFALTRRWNTVAVVTDGSAVLGLGDIGPVAGMPVMEGKCLLFKAYGDVDAIPLCIRSHDVDEIVRTVELIAGSFGGINLEDISAPRCFEIERRLQDKLDIPVFHDDQHGTAIVAAAALVNALKVVKKPIRAVKAVINGAGAAGLAVGKLLLSLGVSNLILCDRNGPLWEGAPGMNREQAACAAITNPDKITGGLSDALKGADVLIGVSRPGLVTGDMVRSMAHDPILFAMANPTPEIMPEEAKAAGARVIGTGRSDFPNQINNVLAFPGIFRGALDAHATAINQEMKLAAVYAIAGLVPEHLLAADNILPTPFDPRVRDAVAQAVKQAAIDTGICRNS